ncbi:hypothetical protein B296_00031864 [Ensete ventricosum]|uniref:Uncharacterized protein n=1 Tax=Ensete ventricosum TaxID=4639 RepID=A0A426XLZ3_ENSVE|nr:hypothetical protein B296_00031864 [Ensete ventricosum]
MRGMTIRRYDQELLGAPLRGAQLPKSKASVRKEVDSEKCHSVAEADLQIAKGRRFKATDSRAMGWQRHGTAEAGLPWSHRSLALMEGER